MAGFRFQNLEIWQEAIRLGGELGDIADRLEQRKLSRYAEQLRGAALSMSNNIAEGSGSISAKEFRQFLNYARRSVFENANMLLFFVARQHLKAEEITQLLADLNVLSARILTFSRSLQ